MLRKALPGIGYMSDCPWQQPEPPHPRAALPRQRTPREILPMQDREERGEARGDPFQKPRRGSDLRLR